MKKSIAVLMLGGVVSMSSLAQEVLFDIGFSAPLHNAGEIPVVNSGSGTPSTIAFGKPEIIQSPVDVLDQALLLNTGDSVNGYEQIQLQVNRAAKRYVFSADIYTDSLIGSNNSFSILFDTPQMRSIDFHGAGKIFAYVPGKASQAIAPLWENTWLHLEIDIDMLTGQWSVYLDGEKMYRDAFDATALSSVRLDLSPWKAGAEGAAETRVVVDNIRLTADIDRVEIAQSVEVLHNAEVGPEGGYVTLRHEITNNTDAPLEVGNWNVAALNEDTLFPVGESELIALRPKEGKVRQSRIYVPRWLPAGEYEIRYYAAISNTPAVFEEKARFTKRQP